MHMLLLPGGHGLGPQEMIWSAAPPGDGLEPLCRDQSAEHYEWPCVPRPPKD